VALALAAHPRGAAAQGLIGPRAYLGASDVRAQLAWADVYAKAAKLRTTDWSKKAGSCKDRGSGTLCGIDVKAGAKKDALMVATSPAVYDTRIPAHNGGFSAAPPPRDQGDCNACVGMALAGAADAAVAMALRRPAGNASGGPLVSVRSLYFCSAQVTAGNCAQGWELRPALDGLIRREGNTIPLEACLPWRDRDGVRYMNHTGGGTAAWLCRAGAATLPWILCGTRSPRRSRPRAHTLPTCCVCSQSSAYQDAKMP
jgi:hypothetical protein